MVERNMCNAVMRAIVVPGVEGHITCKRIASGSRAKFVTVG